MKSSWTPIAAILIALWCPEVAVAFDTGPHFQMTEDALQREGFSADAILLAKSANFFDDLYEKGQGGYFDHLGMDFDEGWNAEAMWLGEFMHFDSSSNLHSAPELEAEWQRLARKTYALVKQKSSRSPADVEGILTVLGMTTHLVQDFYAHTNWVERKLSAPAYYFSPPPFDCSGKTYVSCTETDIAYLIPTCECDERSLCAMPTVPNPGWQSGPGWGATGVHGAHPTWFDVHALDRSDPFVPELYADNRGVNQEMCVSSYGTNPLGLCPDDPRLEHCAGKMVEGGGEQLRGHGNWRSDFNFSLSSGVNKDSNVRPLYQDAYITAYVATRQWVQAMRLWIDDEGVWQAIQGWAEPATLPWSDEIHTNASFAERLSVYAGGWDGNGIAGVPGDADYCYAGANTSLLGLETARRDLLWPYHYQWLWEQNALALMKGCPPPVDVPVPSSAEIQRDLEFVRLDIPKLRQLDTPDESGGYDWSAQAVIAGQEFASGLVDDTTGTDFPRPYGRWRFMKALYREELFHDPIVRFKVQVKSCAPYHHADVFDFPYLYFSSRGPNFFAGLDVDDQTPGTYYEFDVDPWGQIGADGVDLLRIHKEGPSSWCLGGLRVLLNGALIYANDDVNVVLGGNNPDWTAPYGPPAPTLRPAVPVHLRLFDADSSGLRARGLDINQRASETSLDLRYSREARTFGGDVSGRGAATVAGSGDAHAAQVTFALATIPAGAPPPDIYRGVARVFDEATGAGQWVGPGVYRAVDGDLAEVGNDAIDTVTLPPGMRVRACLHEPPYTWSATTCQEVVNDGAALRKVALEPAIRGGGVSYLEVTRFVLGFAGTHYTGAAMAFDPDRTYRAADLGGMDNAISSLIVPPGLSVHVCVRDKLVYTFLDKCTTYKTDQADLPAKYDDRISRLDVLPPRVAVFNGVNLSGAKFQTLPVGSYSAARGNLTVGNNAIRSLLVPPGYSVLVCDGAPGGYCGTYERTMLSLAGEGLDRVISRVRVTLSAPGLGVDGRPSGTVAAQGRAR